MKNFLLYYDKDNNVLLINIEFCFLENTLNISLDIDNMKKIEIINIFNKELNNFLTFIYGIKRLDIFNELEEKYCLIELEKSLEEFLDNKVNVDNVTTFMDEKFNDIKSNLSIFINRFNIDMSNAYKNDIYDYSEIIKYIKVQNIFQYCLKGKLYNFAEEIALDYSNITKQTISHITHYGSDNEANIILYAERKALENIQKTYNMLMKKIKNRVSDIKRTL